VQSHAPTYARQDYKHRGPCSFSPTAGVRAAVWRTPTSCFLLIRQPLTHVLHHTMASRRVRLEEEPDMMDASDALHDELEGDSGAGIEGVQHMAKGLVRYALSCEHSRRPIKRQDINEKGLHLHCQINVVAG
jgi:hypothetical protein